MPIKKGHKLEHFKSKEAYRKYEAFLHMHRIPHHHKLRVVIAGRLHHVVPHKGRRCKYCSG